MSTKFGIEYKHLDGFLKQEFPGGLVDVSSQAKHIAGYMQTNWRPNPLWDINAGLRLNIFSAAKTYYNLAPRISAKYRLSETMNLKAAFGTYNQYLFKIPRTFIVDIWTTADEYYKGAKANHYILGFQKEIAKNIEFEVETYYKDYKNIYSYDYFFYADLEPTKFTDAGEPVYGTTKGIFDTGMGHSYGLEFLLRKDIGCVTGWMSYSLGKTKYKLQDVNNNRYFPPRHDRASTINLVGNIDIKNSIRKLKGKAVKNDKSKWRLGIGFVYASGQPLTTTSSLYVTAPLPDQLYDDGLNLYPTTRNNFRLPAYMRLDLSLTYEKKYTNWTLAPYLQVFNAGNRKNVWYITYDREIKDDMLYQEIETVNMFPILPTLGVNINF